MNAVFSLPCVGQHLYHSWISPRGSHQTQSGGLGQETGTLCRDTGEFALQIGTWSLPEKEETGPDPHGGVW